MEASENPEELPQTPPPAPSDGTVADDLPEWEPLSPELLEDEAIRGDFVLRWAVAGLALLLGCAQLTDARPLVHVRIGEWLAAHGVIPHGNDPFSFSAADRRWIDLNWLFDLLVAGVHALTGPVGLSVMQGLLALAAWALLSHAVRPGIRTWWGSVCATLALLTAMPRLNLTPEIITLCGTAGVLWLLVRCEERRASWWWFVPVLWLWAQMDPRAWLGGGLLLVYGLGQLLNRPDDESAARAWKPIGVAVAAMLLHPHLWETWLAPWTLFQVEYPALRAAYPRPTVYDHAWYPLWSPLLWQQVDFHLVAGLLLFAVTAMTLWLDRARVSASHLLMFAAANFIGLLTLHDVPFASCVNCMLATVHGQSWYLARFGQVYSIATVEVLFSRGGRAITVLALFALSWLVISGRIDGPDGRRSGVGLDRQLRADLESLRQIEPVALDERGFHLTLRQGDSLIAVGRKSFVDHRVRLFTGRGDANLLAAHDRARRSLRRPRPEDATLSPNAWKDVFRQHKVSHVLPRLNLGVTGPDYETLFELLRRPEFMLGQLLPTTAIVHWTSAPDPAVREFAESHSVNALDAAFRKPAALREQPRDHAVTPHWTQQIFSLPRRQPGSSTLLAGHWMRLVSAAPQSPWTFRAACYQIAIRSAQAGVQETPDVPTAFATLAEAYAGMGQTEALLLAEHGVPWELSLRYFQAVSAARECLRLNPDEVSQHALLLELYRSARRVDAAHTEALYLVEHEPPTDPENEFAAQLQERLLQIEGELSRETTALNERAQQELEKGTDRLQIATLMYQYGAIERAAQLLRDDAVYVERNPAARQLLTAALLELGAGTEADDSARRLEAVAEASGLARWRHLLAISALSRGDYTEAISQWERDVKQGDQGTVQGLLYTAPMTTSSPLWMGDLGFPMSHEVVATEAVERRPADQALLKLNCGVCEAERGKQAEAAAAIREALHRAPSNALRPLLRLYLYCLTEELLDPEPPDDWIPIEDIFAPEL